MQSYSRVSNLGQANIIDLKVAVMMWEGFRFLSNTLAECVYVLETLQDLVDEVADVAIAYLLALEQFVQVCLYCVLHDVNIPDGFHGGCLKSVSDA